MSANAETNQPPKLNWGFTFLIGFGFFGISVLWTLYNAYVPIYLQAGNPTFEAPGEVGFGLDPFWTGVIMTLDNVAAFFLLPLIGVWSDRVWTRFGRRMPFILVLAPISVAAFVLIPVAVRMVPPELSGQIGELGVPLAFFMVAIGVFLTAMASFRTPVIALMPDLTPSPLRSQANGIINLMGGVGTLIATVGSGILYGMGRIVPFVFGGILMLAAVLMLHFFVKEPKEFEAAVHEDERLGALRGLRRVSPAARRSLAFLMGAIFCWFVGYNAVETFLSSYGVSELGMGTGQAPLLMGVASLAFLIFAVPSGYIAARFGRRRTIVTGLTVFGILLAANFFLRNATLIWPIMAIGGMGWALVNINSLPMVVDIAVSAADLGTYTGMYYIASQLAAVVGPIVNGYIVKLGGGDYNLIFLATPAFFVLAILCMMGVTKGEAKESG
ncbi:MAG: SLC45 family MFS transporter [Anaerolineae bacterium]|nr:SLC45 family MFS transporter [Anaerolineae bacterium]